MKVYVVVWVEGGMMNGDPDVYLDRSQAIAQYLDYLLRGWRPIGCENCPYTFPNPTAENFDTYFDTIARCPNCEEEMDMSTRVGHDDNDLYFYDGIEVQE